MTSTVFTGSPDPGKQIFTVQNFLVVIGFIMMAGFSLAVWNLKGINDDVHTAVSTATEAKGQALSNKDALDRMSRTEARIANISIDHETRLSLIEQHDHIARQPSIHLYDGR